MPGGRPRRHAVDYARCVSAIGPAVTLRRPTTGDVDAAAELHAWSWRATYDPLLPVTEQGLFTADERRRLWARALAAPGADECIWLAEADGRVVGLVFGGRSIDGDAAPDVGEIHAIHVEPGLHGRGIGRILLDAALVDLGRTGFGEATLWVIRENRDARRFYEGLGWRLDGAEKRGRMGDLDGLPVVDEVRYRRSLAPASFTAPASVAR